MPRGIKVILLCILVLAAVWVGMMLDRLGRLEFVHDQHGTGLMFMALEERPPPFGGGANERRDLATGPGVQPGPTQQTRDIQTPSLVRVTETEPRSTLRRRANPELDGPTPATIDEASPGDELVPFLKGYNLRGLRCKKDWQNHPNEPVCFSNDGTACPASITPPILHTGDNGKQWVCTKPKEYLCMVECSGPDKEAKWMAAPCGKDPDPDCPDEEGHPPPPPPPGLRGGGAVLADKAKDESSKVEVPNSETKSGDVAAKDLKDKPVDPNEPMIDLRGLNCELLEGKEVCFMEDSQGREICPDHVTSAFLTRAKGQWLCQDTVPTHYCTAACQQGNQEVRWLAHERAWCQKNPGSCPPEPRRIPASQFELKPWSQKARKTKACEAPGAASKTPAKIEGVTVAILARGKTEQRTLKDTLTTYKDLGFLSRVPEILIYVNERTPAMDRFLKPYADEFGIKVMGDAKNHGIARALNWLVGNATQPYFLFLEKDFQLVDPWPCVYEQLQSGKELIDANTAQVVRYRSRDRPGRPNWAERMFRGKEEKVFSQQPNLFCNHYYWIENPEEQWPDKIWRCKEQPSVFYCSKAYYCNWTNNPVLFTPKWWITEYSGKDGRFGKFKRMDPMYDLESYMNWEPGAWNDRPWIVAQGDGLFKHVDRRNFGF